MYIAPNSDIWLLSGIPIDPMYNHTVLFSSEVVRNSTFINSTYLVKHLTNQYYTRTNRNTIKVECKAEELYGVNYMVFLNRMNYTTNPAPKYFFAFITNVEWINNEVTELTYIIDDMVTYMFDYQLLPCFVDREHSSTDSVGDNLVPEDVPISEYTYNNDYRAIVNLSDSKAVLVGVNDVYKNNGLFTGVLYDADYVVTGVANDGIYSGVNLKAFLIDSQTGVDNLNAFITRYVQKPEAILFIYMCPARMIQWGAGTTLSQMREGVTISSTWSGINETVTPNADSITCGNNIHGYTPKNNKLFTFPYNFFGVDDSNGSSLALRYEFFDGNSVKFNLLSTAMNPAQATLRPKGYKGSIITSGGSTTQYPLNSESLTISNFPQCSWTVDSQKVWLAQNAIPILLKVGTGLATTPLNAISGFIEDIANSSGPRETVMNVLAEGASTLSKSTNQVTKSLIAQYKRSIAEDFTKGAFGGIAPTYVNGQCGFFGGRLSVTAECAEIIDNYFTMYGYATKKLKVPSRDSRLNFNYVKTIGCHIAGNVPSEAIANIQKIYDGGVTFWHHMAHVGDYAYYSYNNPIRST